MQPVLAGYPKQSAVPGGVVHIPLPNQTKPPKVYFGIKRVMVIPTVNGNKRSWLAVVGIPLTEKAGKKHIDVKLENGIRKVAFTIKNKKYKAQHLRSKKKYVSPNKKQLDRILSEKKRIIGLLETWQDTASYFGKFEAPVRGRLSSPFGLRRFFNKKPRSPHKGIDIAAPLGTPLKSPAPAKVLDTGNYYFNGNTVFLDHGQGLITMYCHMNNIAVQPGSHIKPGQVIGSVGKTGRVTGPHVHWAVFLNGTAVDPLLFLPRNNLRKK